MDSAGFVQQAFGTEAGRFVLLDTHEPGRADGALCRRRLDWLEAELRADQAAPLFLFLHHPPFRVGLQHMDRIRLLDDGPLLGTLRPHLPRAAATALLAEVRGGADLSLRVGQGVDMGRPSLLLARAGRQGGAMIAYVGGRCVTAMEGSFRLPAP